MATRAELVSAYLAYFGRPPDFDGLKFYENIPYADVISNFSKSPESQALYGTVFGAAQINAIYQNLFNRDAEPAGLDYWSGRVNSGALSPAAAALGIMQGAQNADKTSVDNKIAIINLFESKLDTAAEIVGYSGTAAAASARAYIKTVDSTAASVTAATTGADAAVAAAVQQGSTAPGAGGGLSFAMSTLVDNLVGTGGNDSFTADNTGATAQASAADTINGGGGFDTLRLFSKGTAATLDTLPALTAVEGLTLVGLKTGAAQTIDVSGITGLTTLTLEATIADGAANNAATVKVGAGQSVVLFGNTTNLTGTTDYTNTTTINSSANTAESVTVNKYANTVGTGTGKNTQILDISGTKAATLNLTAQGTASSFSLTNTGLAVTAITVAGDKGITFATDATLSGQLKSVNASTATGAATIDVSAGTVVPAFAFTGGAGNDKLTLAAGNVASLTSGAQLDGGAGTDTLVIKDTTPAYTAINLAKNFEVLGLGVTATTVDASLLTSIKSFSTGVATTTINNLGVGSSVAITAATTAVTLGAAVGNTATDITLGTATGAGFTTTALTTTGLTTVGLTANGTSAHTITTITNSDNTVFTIKGAADLTITNALAGGTTGSQVNATALTGKLTVTGSGKADIITGGAAADTIISGNGDDVVTGGAGADKFVTNTSATGGMDWVKDMVAGTDKIITTGNAAHVTTVVAVIDKGALSTTTYADLNAAIASFAAAGANATTATNAYTFSYAGDSYVIVDMATAGYAAANDAIVKITGLTGTLTTTDLIYAA